MDYLGLVKGAVEKGGEIYGDYQRGKQIRLGEYSGAGNVKNLGHYNNRGKKLGIYHM
jgi:hypothetical protein